MTDTANEITFYQKSQVITYSLAADLLRYCFRIKIFPCGFPRFTKYFALRLAEVEAQLFPRCHLRKSKFVLHKKNKCYLDQNTV